MSRLRNTKHVGCICVLREQPFDFGLGGRGGIVFYPSQKIFFSSNWGSEYLFKKKIHNPRPPWK